MSEFVTSKNIDLIVEKNREIKDEITEQVMKFQMNREIMKVSSMPQMALMILKRFGLVQMPIEDKFWSGAIYVKNGKMIPIINTALPRANQYFTAWHEIYHLIFDVVSFDHFIENDTIMEERKAEYFAGRMLLDGVERFFWELPEMELQSKIFYCMSTFQAPYKAVLVSLYEFATQSENESLRQKIRSIFDQTFENLPEEFRKLGLDDSLVQPSYVINTVSLQEKIRKQQALYPELNYHKENAAFLKDLMQETEILVRNKEWSN